MSREGDALLGWDWDIWCVLLPTGPLRAFVVDRCVTPNSPISRALEPSRAGRAMATARVVRHALPSTAAGCIRSPSCYRLVARAGVAAYLSSFIPRLCRHVTSCYLPDESQSLAMATDSPSQGALALVESITKLGEGLKNGEQGAREGLLGACSKLIAELSHPSETMLQLLWAQPSHLSVIRMGVEIKLFQAMQHIDATGEPTTEIAAKCEPKTDPVLVGAHSQNRQTITVEACS